MKKTYVLFVLFFSILFLSTSYSQLLVEDFDYPAGDTLTNHGWIAHSGTGTNPVTVNATGLEYPGYVSSGVGLAALLDNTGEDIHRTFTAQTSGIIYYSCLVNVTNAVAGYFIHLGTGATTFAARVFVQPSANAGKINFGVSNSSTAVYGTTDFDPLTTYLLIVKYEVANPTSNVSLWVVPSGVPATEVDAGVPEVTTTTGTGLANVDGIYLRQYSATQNIVVDGIRVGTGWNVVVAGPQVGDYGSVADGNWGTASTWVVCTTAGTWTGATAASGQPNETNNVWVRDGDTVTVEASSKRCANLIVENGGTLIGGTALPTSSIVYVRVYGPTTQFDGTVGAVAPGNNISFELYGNVTMAGTGNIYPARIRPGSAITDVTLTIDCDMTMMYNGSSGTGGAAIYTGNGTADNITITLNEGRTVNFVDYAYLGTSSSTSVDGTASTTFNINGTLVQQGVSASTTLRVAAGKTCTLNIGPNGSLSVSKNLNASYGAGTVVITNDGTLNLGTGGNGILYFDDPNVYVGGTGTTTIASGSQVRIGAPAGLDAANGPFRTTTTNYDANCNYNYLGTEAQVTGTDLPSTVYKLTIANPLGVTLSSAVALTDTGTISNGASLVESDANYVAGVMKTTQTVGTGASTLGGIGVSLNAGGADSLGNVTVVRTSGTAPTSSSFTAINRSWDISSENPPTNGRDLTLSWASGDDGSADLTKAVVFKSTDAGSNWSSESTEADVTATHSATANGVTSFSLWTVGSASTTPTAGLSGDYYIGAAGTGPGGSDPGFATLRDAFQVINDTTFAGNCTFYITSDIEETFTPAVGYGLGLAANPDPYTITFKPYTGVQPVITLDYPTDGTSGPSGALIIGIPMDNNIAWADIRPTKNIIIDGSNTVDGTTRDLTIQSAPTAHRNAMTVVVVGDVSNLTIKNTNIYYKVQTVSTSGNLFIGAVQVRSRNEGGLDRVPHDLIFENNHISGNFDGNAQNSQGYGLYQSGTPVPATYPYNITLKNNIIEGKRRAISLYRAGSHEIFGNEIILNQNIAANTTNEAIYAVDVDTNSVVNIYNNKITKVSSMTNAANSGNTAISIESFGTYNVYNNMISGFELTAANPVAYVRGVKNSSANASLNYGFNTIYMTDLEDIGTGNVAYSGIYVSKGTNNIGDNIVVSAEKDFMSYCFDKSDTLAIVSSNYNDFYPGTAGVVGRWDTLNTTTLADWQTASGQDANSVSKEVFFVSDNDLHLAGSSIGDVSLAGFPVGLTTDIDGDIRSTTYPYMGADEASVELQPTITIAEAIEDLNNDFVPDKLGQTVTVQGVVFSPNYQTTNNSFYISDGTAGTDIFMYGPPVYTWNLGDDLKITGVVTQYNGMSEIVVADTTGWIFMSSGNPTSDTAKITLAEFKANPELYEGSLVGFVGLNLVGGTWPASGSSTNLSLSDGIDTVVFRIDSDTDIDGSPEPSWPADVVGIGSQFDNSAPYNSGYQIFPRYATDFTSKPTSVENEKTTVTEFSLAQNYPNPFNPTTRINYSIPVESKVSIAIYSITGELVKELVNTNLAAGNYSVDFDGSSLASGVYIYRMIAGSFVQVHKMMLMK